MEAPVQKTFVLMPGLILQSDAFAGACSPCVETTGVLKIGIKTLLLSNETTRLRFNASVALQDTLNA